MPRAKKPVEPPPPRRPCIGPTKSGKPCPAYALPDGMHCSNHDPKQAARRREMGAIRKPQPVDTTAEGVAAAAKAIASRPRTIQGVADTAWDHLTRVRAGEADAIVTAELVFKGLKVALDAHKAVEDGKRQSRRAGASVTPDAPAAGGTPAAPGPTPSDAVSLLGAMIAERQREGGSVQ